MPAELRADWRLEQGAPIGPQLYRILRERIIAADLPPGSRLSEGEIASAYGISRQPVREAFIKLAEAGLVEIRPQRGTLVRRIAPAAVMDARFVREAIEADIVRLVARSADEALTKELNAQIARQRAVADSNARDFLTLDELFHRTLAEAAGKTYAWKVIEDVKAQMDRVRYLTALHFPKQALIAQHAEIVEAIARRDEQAAEKAMRGHLRRILADLPEITAARPEFFETVHASGQAGKGETE
ncbi:Transcriptional regulator [Rubellimicrobium thermophilum DSM 16684]|uniref:Transcriptional regulator n=1 Tax=Rubellimicrobium thermophilum DSM 16684 TaxID=1123069 RepID=S9QW21_9RHOB|nr:GntR family transcriptional regulator [Rubellimicrobium thermophilum]EPX83777.1 Transcriptional regulator [Rubellimicrobium thermophilum DSM 16684]